MTTQLGDYLRTRMRRRSWTANPADPTLVTRWSFQSKWLDVTIISSWGVESLINLGPGFPRWMMRTWRTYDARFFTWLFGVLEDAHERYQAQFDDDPMGRLEDYV